MIDTKRFKGLIDSFHEQLFNIHHGITNTKLTEDKWSLREIIGHMIDSASNNHQRFVRLQLGDLLDFPVYDAEEWVSTQNYNNIDWDVLAALWYNYNCVLLQIIENIDGIKLKNVWVKGEDTISLEQLIFNYYRHLEFHMDHFSKRLKELP